MALDLKQQLMTDGKLTAEQADAFMQQFGAQLTPVFESTYAERDRTAQAQAQFAKDQQQLQQASDNLTREMAEWASMTEKEKLHGQSQAAALEAARVKVAQIETRLATTAQQYGFDPNAILEGTAVIPEKKQDAPTFDTSKFLNREQVAPVFDYQLDLMGTLHHLATEHQQLFGTPLDTREVVKEIKARAAKNDSNIDPEGIWREKFGVDAKRAEVQKATYDAAIQAAEARGREAALTERAMPGPAIQGQHSPVFRNASGQFQPRESRLQRPAPESGARSAAAALATHKYRQPDSGAR